jgi:hypothetical protein
MHILVVSSLFFILLILEQKDGDRWKASGGEKDDDKSGWYFVFIKT